MRANLEGEDEATISTKPVRVLMVVLEVLGIFVFIIGSALGATLLGMVALSIAVAMGLMQ